MEHVFRNITEALPSLMGHVLGGTEIGSRNGVTKERLYEHIVLTNPCERVITHPLRKASLPAQIAETMWVLSGRNDMEFLSHYLPRAKDFSDDGETWRAGYGPRIREWVGRGEDGILSQDQLAFVIYELRQNPASRRAVISIYDPIIDDQPGKDIPCNNWLHFLSREGRLHLHVAIRSNDLMWGWSGINAFEWSALLEIVAAMTGMLVGELHFSISSLHLYAPHWDKARRIEQLPSDEIQRQPKPDPRFAPLPYWRTAPVGALDQTFRSWFRVEKLIRESHPTAREEVEAFQDPMLRSWLRVIGWYWTGEESYIDPLIGSPLYFAAVKGPKRKAADGEDVTPAPADFRFLEHASMLHAEKHAAYGDSWKKRGESFSIIPNIARKVDRLAAGTATSDETSLDTAEDLLLYLSKYRWWLTDVRVAPAPCDLLVTDEGTDPEVQRVSSLLVHLKGRAVTHPISGQSIPQMFENLVNAVENSSARRPGIVDQMLIEAYRVAHKLYWKAGNATRSWNPEKEI